MIKIEQKTFGYKLTFSAIISHQEVEQWLDESEKVLADSPQNFCVLINMCEMELLPVECREAMYDGQKLYKRMGMNRSVVIVRDKMTAMQFRLIAQKTGIYAEERYINAAHNQDWEKEAMNWLINSVEPTIEPEMITSY